MIREYLIVDEYSIEELEKEVDDFLRDGWELQGGLAISSFVDPDTHLPVFRFCQALVSQGGLK